jgi:general secretion pathway protein L
MLAEFAHWWVTQMRALAQPFLPSSPAQPDALIVAIEAGDEISGTLLLRRDGKEMGLHRLEPGRPRPAAAPPGLATGLRLPPGAVLSRELVLPLAAARDLRTVINFEMDRITPFSADELYWGVSGITQDRARARLSLTLSLALRSQVEALRAMLAGCNLAPSFIEAGAGRIELAGSVKRQDWHWRKGVAILCGVLALACIVTPFVRQQVALDAAAEAVADATPAARTAEALRQQLATAAQGVAAIAQARHQGDALQVLATLTDALPDDTFLSDLTLKNGDLTFDGQSANAAHLIGLLSTVPGLRDPSFTAPVTRSADGKADLFSLHATVSE